MPRRPRMLAIRLLGSERAAKAQLRAVNLAEKQMSTPKHQFTAWIGLYFNSWILRVCKAEGGRRAGPSQIPLGLDPVQTSETDGRQLFLHPAPPPHREASFCITLTFHAFTSGEQTFHPTLGFHEEHTGSALWLQQNTSAVSLITASHVSHLLLFNIFFYTM